MANMLPSCDYTVAIEHGPSLVLVDLACENYIFLDNIYIYI